MAHGRDKDRSRRNRLIVRKLLNEEWDPIGGCPDDEYDTYSKKLYVMLIDEGASAQEMTEYLWWAETEYIGLGQRDGRRQSCAQVVDKLLAMKPSLEAANDQ